MATTIQLLRWPNQIRTETTLKSVLHFKGITQNKNKTLNIWSKHEVQLDILKQNLVIDF